MEKNKERIAKKIAAAGLCSRRVAEQWIIDGRVSVNGQKLLTPAFCVSDEDVVEVDGTVLPQKAPDRVWLYYKPTGLLTTHKDPQGRPTVFESLSKALPRVVSVGRLDFNSEGLLILTTSGKWAHAMEKSGWKRTYRVRIHGSLNESQIAQIQKGLTIKGIHYAGADVFVEPDQSGGKNSWIRITLKEGKNREIRKMMEFFGCQVNRLIRISYGPFQLGKMQERELKEVPSKNLKEFLSCALLGEI